MSYVRTSHWVLLTTLGLAAGLLAGLVAGIPLDKIVNAMITTAAVTLVVGAVLGGFQAIGLRRVLAQPVWWVIATAVGIGIGLATGVVVVEQTGILLTGVRPNIARLTPLLRAASLVTVGVVTGTIAGALQSLVFRQQHLDVKHWIAASGIGLALAFFASSYALEVIGLPFATLPGVIAFVVVAGAAFGALTIWPLQRAVTA